MVSLAITMPVLLIEKLGLPVAIAVVMTGTSAPLANSIAPGGRMFRHV